MVKGTMSPMMNFIAELKRRNVLRVSLVYVVAAWLIMQVARAARQHGIRHRHWPNR